MANSKYETFMTHVRKAVGRDIYLWGAGQPVLKNLSEITVTFIRNKETSTDNANRVIKLWNERKNIFPDAYAADCSGGIIYCMMLAGLVSKSYDATANMLLNKCTQITKSQLKEGDWVGQKSGSNIFHIGVVDRIDYDGTIWINEWRGRDAGCVCTRFEQGARPWNVFGRPTAFYDNSQSTVSKPTLPNLVQFTLTRKLSVTSPYMRGQDVHDVQNNLIAHGISCGSTGADGIYGGGTKDAVRKFQKEKSLTVNGMIDEETCVALGGIWKVGNTTSTSKPTTTTPPANTTTKPVATPTPTPVAPPRNYDYTLRRVLKYTGTPIMQGEDVKELQKFLIKQGYSVGSCGADGKFGTNTRDAVIAWQAKQHIFPDGIVGAQTADKMNWKFIR